MKVLVQGHTASKQQSWGSDPVLPGLFLSTAQASSGGVWVGWGAGTMQQTAGPPAAPLPHPAARPPTPPSLAKEAGLKGWYSGLHK